MSKTLTPEFRMAFPNLFKPRKNDLNGKEEFSVVALFKKGENLKALEALVQDTIKEKWGADKSKHPKNLKLPFRMQEERAKDGALPDGYVEGAVFINLKSTQRPGVVNQSVQPIIDESEIYSGCWGRASVRAFAYDQKGNRGVSLSLTNIQKTREDDPLTGRPRAEDEFAPITSAQADSADKLF